MVRTLFVCITIAILFLIVSCQTSKKDEAIIKKQEFGKLPDGREAYLFTLKNQNGSEVKITNYGAIVVSLLVPDRNGKLGDVVLGYDSLDGYVKDKSFLGTIVGRYGNRIAKGRFTLDGKEYQLDINDGENSLHGGSQGFFKKLWDAEPIESKTDPALKLTYLSKDGEEGYPGDVTITVTYTLTKDNELRIDYVATTDKPTILNPTHHSYFNLSGDPTKTILDEDLMINADKFTPIDKGLIPTGILENVINTPMNFLKPTQIGLHINDNNEQLKFARGYDFNWVLNNYNKKVRLAATVYDSSSGRFMEVLTDQPGLQFYSGNFLDGSVIGKKGIKYNYRTALCLEAQDFPDAPNKPNFPSAILRPGETYRQTTIYKFSIK
jgi:aldose 1-epimerase